MDWGNCVLSGVCIRELGKGWEEKGMKWRSMC